MAANVILHMWINQLTMAVEKGDGSKIDIKICLYVYCAFSPPLIRDGPFMKKDIRRP
jgi:hypothetical protein